MERCPSYWKNLFQLKKLFHWKNHFKITFQKSLYRIMESTIKNLRKGTGLTQKEFASRYGIPVSTLRKWEQGEASPPPYLLTLLAGTIPASKDTLKAFKGDKGHLFYYDEGQRLIYDASGNAIRITEELDGVKEQNLGLYLEDLFDGLYRIQEKFDRDCQFDKKEDIIWERF